MWNVIAQETLSSSGPCSSSKPSNSPIFDVHSPSYPLVSILTSYTPHLVDALYGAILVFFGLFFWISPSLALVIHISPSGLPGGWRLIGALKHDVGTASRLYMLPCRSLWCLVHCLYSHPKIMGSSMSWFCWHCISLMTWIERSGNSVALRLSVSIIFFVTIQTLYHHMYSSLLSCTDTWHNLL